MNNEDKILQMLEQMQSDINEVKSDMNSRLDKMDSRLDNLETDVKYIRIGQDEHGQILNALISRTDIHRAKADNLNIEVAKISGSVKSIETKVDLLTEDLNSVEQITAKNYTDIVRLKAK